MSKRNQNKETKTQEPVVQSEPKEEQAPTQEAQPQVEGQMDQVLKRLEALEAENKKLRENSAGKEIARTPRRKAKEGFKFIKAQVLTDDGDLTWGLIEVPKEDKRRAIDPDSPEAAMTPAAGVGKGNPQAGKEGTVVGF